MLVDDDYEIIESMKMALESRGYEILVARDGNQGLAMAERENPDLLILDMMMPKRSGFLVLEKLRRSRPVPLRVIMITANEGSRHKVYAEMLGVDEYLRKPFAMDRLLESVATATELTGSGGGLRSRSCSSGQRLRVSTSPAGQNIQRKKFLPLQSCLSYSNSFTLNALLVKT